jgi:pilus assembly protein FimV
MLGKLGSTIAIASAFIICNVNALGLGEIKVKSALNEPLHAEIDIFQVKNLSPLQIQSRMADLNDFALSGLATQRALSDVRFQTRVRENGTGRIILTSKLPVTEPFMNFLVEVNWPSGRLIREYTLLLDPPSYQTQQNNRNFNANNTNAQSPTVIAAPASKRVVPVKARVPSNVTIKQGQYYISAKDTLWDIAIANRPSKRVTPQQMMVLMQRKNPDAFPNGNINVMKANVVIDIPTQAEIDALSVKDAQTEVDRQTGLWRSGNLPSISTQENPQTTETKATIAQEINNLTAPADNGSNSNEAAKKDADKQIAQASPESKKTEAASSVTTDEMLKGTAADIKTPVEEKGMLNVLSPEEEAQQRESKAKADALAIASSKDAEKIADLLRSNAELDVKLALSQESMDKLERDNVELNKKLSVIAKQLEDINRLISLKDEQLAVMQEEFALVEQNQIEQEDERKQLEDDKSWLDRLLENTIGMIAAGIGWLLAIVAGVLLLLRRKKKDQSEIVETEKSEPTVSLPDDEIEEEISTLEELDGSPENAEQATDEDDLDLDLDLDLDMDMDLDESLENGVLDLPEDDDDLSDQLDAQLEVEDDDLELLDGIDSLEFDLGEGDDDLEISLDEDDQNEELEQEDLDEPVVDSAEETKEEAEQRALAEFAAAMEEPDDSSDVEDELEIELEDDEITAVDDEIDISELTEDVSTLDEMSDLEQEATESVDIEASDEMFEEALEETLEEPLPEDIELELAEDDSETEQALEDELDQEQTLDEDEELSLDDALLEEEDEEDALPMDDALFDMLNDTQEELDSDADEVQSEPVKDPQEELEDQVADLLSSTDDDIALEEMAPEFDEDNEDNMDLLSGEDGLRMKLDLARAYIEMGDADGAKDIIKEVMDGADAEHHKEAQELLDSIG